MSARLPRLDQLMAERGLAVSRERARGLILAGRVQVGGERVDKAGTRVPPDAAIRVLSDPNPYVSRGGLKLEAALQAFSVEVEGKVALDVGASTGGFTHCLLKAGASRVIALDVGHGQLDWGLRQDPRVTVIERFNARELTSPRLAEKAAPWDGHLDLAVVDVSFISLALILPPLAGLQGLPRVIALVKPQFEAGRDQVGRKGIVRDPEIHRQVLEKIADTSRSCGWHPCGLIPSPVTGAEGNREFLMDLQRQQEAVPKPFSDRVRRVCQESA